MRSIQYPELVFRAFLFGVAGFVAEAISKPHNWDTALGFGLSILLFVAINWIIDITSED